MSDEFPTRWIPRGRTAAILVALEADQPLTNRSISKAAVVGKPNVGNTYKALLRLERRGLVRQYRRFDGVRLWVLANFEGNPGEVDPRPADDPAGD